MSQPPDRDAVRRRTFLAGAGAAALAGLAACSPADEGGDQPTDGASPVPFRSARQLGVLREPMAAGAVAAFDVAVADRAELAETLQVVSTEIERIMAGGEALAADAILPPPDAGIVDAAVGTAGTAITLGVGASLFDQRFGLADRLPAELIPMPRFFNDRLVQPERSDGDLVVLISSPSPQAVLYALQQLVRVGGRRLKLRWAQEGYNDLLPPEADSIARTRNLMGFRDGTSNLAVTNESAMNEHVWVQTTDDEPDWAADGTYLAVRTIRMLIEFWSTTALVRQEQIIGPHRGTGAPLGQQAEGDEPAFAQDPNDETIPRRAHIRLANPRTTGTARILRRGFSYMNGVDQAGTLDQGLLFLAFQRSLNNGFLAVQQALNGEPMEDYIKPVGGGLYFVLPGPADDGWLGQDLLT